MGQIDIKHGEVRISFFEIVKSPQEQFICS